MRFMVNFLIIGFENPRTTDCGEEKRKSRKDRSFIRQMTFFTLATKLSYILR